MEINERLYVVNENGQRVAVIIPIKEYEELVGKIDSSHKNQSGGNKKRKKSDG